MAASCLIFFILIMVMVIYLQWPRCTAITSLDTSVTVKTIEKRSILGINTDTDSLKFGVVSPGIDVIRSVNVQYNHDARVVVLVSGVLTHWISVDPMEFDLSAQEIQPVSFVLQVPVNAPDGNYTGGVLFCFQE